ncbi:MAG: RDD family protein [Betaproteobacteria bacterium]|nr:RDD family protein [Betaproteobacteria bacterium]
MLDTVREISTPELIELRVHCAGPVPRALAWLLDTLIRAGIFALANIALGFVGHIGGGIMLILYFGLEWLYPVFFEVLGGGATPGKRALGLYVLHQDGSPVGWGASLTRNLLRTVDFLPFLYTLGLISMLLTSEFRRIGDLVAGTIVAYRIDPTPLPEVPAAPAWRPRIPLTRPLQQAVLAYAERAPRLSPERAEELAEIAPQLTAGAQGRTAVERLYGLARVLTGQAR